MQVRQSNVLHGVVLQGRGRGVELSAQGEGQGGAMPGGRADGAYAFSGGFQDAGRARVKAVLFAPAHEKPEETQLFSSHYAL